MDPSVLRAFKDRLTELGYFHFLSAFGGGVLRPSDYREVLGDLPADLVELVKLFALGEPVDRQNLAKLLGNDATDLLYKLDILTNTDTGEVLTSFRMIFVRGLAYLYQEAIDPAIYFGDDSMGLIGCQVLPHDAIALDLCSGPGIQALVAAAFAKVVYSVEINPKASVVARINATMNGLQDRIRFVNSSGEEFLKGCNVVFDHITFNPPLVPVPAGFTYPFVGDGGPDGLDVSRRLVEAAAPRLSNRGAIYFIGTSYNRAAQRDYLTGVLQTMANKHNLVSQINLVSGRRMEQGNEFFDSLVATTAQHCRTSFDEIKLAYLDYCEKNNVDELILFSAAFRKKGFGWSAHMNERFYGAWFV